MKQVAHMFCPRTGKAVCGDKSAKPLGIDPGPNDERCEECNAAIDLTHCPECGVQWNQLVDRLLSA